jgi:hypothetical protein
MKMQLTPQDQQLLSAYLDGQLSKRERAQLETRLSTQPGLNNELESLRRTRALLRLTPQRRAPRNYTLKPETVAEKHRGFQWVPTLRFSSALASILAMASIAFNLLPLAGGAMAPLAAPDMVAASDTSLTPEIQVQASKEPTPMILIWGGASQIEILGGIGSGPATTTVAGERILAPQATPSPDVEKAAGETNTTPTVTTADNSGMLPIEGSGPILGVRPTEEAGQIQPQESYAVGQEDDPVMKDESAEGSSQGTPNIPSTTNPWIIPGALLIVALFTGLLSYTLQRKKL